MKRNKSILHLCEVILGVLMLILILNLYLVKLLVDPDISYTPMYRNLCLTLALLVFCMVLALIQRELLARRSITPTGMSPESTIKNPWRKSFWN